MTKITTKFIKDNILPSSYYRYAVTDWKRATKRKFDYDAVLDDGTVLKGKLNWRCYSSEEHYTNYYIIDDGTTVLYKGDDANLPGYVYDWAIHTEDDSIDIFIGYNEKYNDLGEYGDAEDNLREYSVAGFAKFFDDLPGVAMENTMENTFALYIFDESVTVKIDNFDDVKVYLEKLMLDNFGMKYESQIEYLSEEWNPEMFRGRVDELREWL